MEQLLYNFGQYKVLAAIIGFILIIIETFIPVLPLIAIIVANAYILGVWKGFFISWIASCVASIGLYYISNKFSKIDILQKYHKNKKVLNIVRWVKKQGFNSIFIAYVCPFIPDFLVSISSGFAGIDFKDYVLGMISGKFVMFLFISYMGKDIDTLIYNPQKIMLLTVTIIISWIVGKNINRKIHKN